MKKNTSGSDSFVEDSFAEEPSRDAPAPVASTKIKGDSALSYLLNAAGVSNEMLQDVKRGLLTNEPAQNMTQSISRSVPATAGGMVGAGAGLIGGGVGAAAGEGLRQGLVGINSAMGNTRAPTTMEAVGGPAADAALQVALPVVGKQVYKAAGKTITGMSDFAMTRLLDRPSEVAKSAAMNPEAAPALAKEFKGLIETNLERAGNAYRGLIEKVIGSNPKYGADFKIDLKSALGPTIDEVRKDFGYGLKGRLAEVGEAKMFEKFAKQAGKLEAATPEEAYYFQRDLNNVMRSNKDKPLYAALKRLKTTTMDTLEKKIPEVAEGNKIYAMANELADDLSKVQNADDAVGIIKNATLKKGETNDALLKAADQIAGARQKLEATLDATAGREFDPWVGNLPRTGLTAGIGAIAGKYTEHPEVAAAMAPFLSPRTVAYGARAAASKPGQAAWRGGAVNLRQALGEK